MLQTTELNYMVVKKKINKVPEIKLKLVSDFLKLH